MPPRPGVHPRPRGRAPVLVAGGLAAGLAVALVAGLAACSPVATLWPEDDCRVGAEAAAIVAEVRCDVGGEAHAATLAFDAVERVEAAQGAGWAGLSVGLVGRSAGGGALKLAWRPDGLRLASTEGDLVLDLDGASAEVVATWGGTPCDAGTVAISGLPAGWTEDGAWAAAFGADGVSADTVADAWDPPWPSDCPLAPRAWAASRVTARCAGTTVADVQFLAPAAYAVDLDALGRPVAVEAAWDGSFDAACAGDVAPSTEGTLVAEGGTVALTTDLVEVARDAAGAWTVVDSACGTCDAWEASVEGLPGM